MSYIPPKDLAHLMVDAGATKATLSTRDTLIRAYMAGAILALAAAFAVTVAVQTGIPLVGALVFPVGFCMLSLLGFDLLTGVFTMVPFAVLAKRPGCTPRTMLRCWGLVFAGNFAGAMTTATFMAIIMTTGFSHAPDAVGQKLMTIGEARTIGYAEAGGSGMLTLFVRAVMCNWMVSTGVVAAMMSTSIPGKVIGMWMPILIFFFMGFEHSVVNMFLFPVGLLMGAEFTWMNYFMYNEIPTVIGNLVGGLVFVGSVLFFTYYRETEDRVVPGYPDGMGRSTHSVYEAAE